MYIRVDVEVGLLDGVILGGVILGVELMPEVKE